MRRLVVLFLLATLHPFMPSAVAVQNGFDPRVVTFGTSRAEIKSTPIEKRPYRPLHVYGNTVRRRVHRSR